MRGIVFFFLAAPVFLLAPPSGFADSARLSGKVVMILQGDTIKVDLKKSKPYVFLYGITCPSKQQSFGERARKFTGDHSFGRIVTLVPKSEARRDGMYADVILPDGRNLNQELLELGLCQWDRKYASTDKELERRENEARRLKLGLWSGQ